MAKENDVGARSRSGDSVSGKDRANGVALLREWWELRRKRQAEIDAAIAKNADLRLPIADLKNKSERKIQVTIKGLDIYDPTTGEIRSDSTEDIDCWFIDTNYNEESFFVRHACFCGGDQPYEKLQRALRAEINESAWSALYSTVSRPFDPPGTGKIAIKVINHYGDEVLKVYSFQKKG